MALVGPVLKYLRRHGLRRTIPRIVNRGIYGWQKLVITRIRLDGPPAEHRVGEIELRAATASDLNNLGELERYDRRGSIIRAHVEEDGDWLFVACHGRRIVGTRLVSRTVPPLGVVSRVVTLGPGQVWGGEVFCVPDARGQGIARHLSTFGDRHMASLGYTEIFGVVDAGNIPSLRMHRHKGVQFVCYVTYVRLLFFERLRVSPDIPHLDLGM